MCWSGREMRSKALTVTVLRDYNRMKETDKSCWYAGKKGWRNMKIRSLLTVLLSVLVVAGAVVTLDAFAANFGEDARIEASSVQQEAPLDVETSFVCEVEGCKREGVHAPGLCPMPECTETLVHVHDGACCYAHSADDGHAYHVCGVEGCTLAGAHVHNSCGVEGCTLAEEHAHNSCGVEGCTLAEEHTHNSCGVSGCAQTGEHVHGGCGVSGCTQTGEHVHNSCGVSGCAQTGEHVHNSCGVSGCTQTGEHTHQNGNAGGHGHRAGRHGGHH